MLRFLTLLFALLALAAPARADDSSAAGRSVVRVVVITFEDGEVADFGHGSGFAVAPNRVVTNAHVIQQAAQFPDMVAVGVVPSEGSRAYRARILSVDPARDLALLAVEEGTVPPIPLYIGAVDDGAPVAALGYPGNVDLATARSADDYITPLPPTRSVGIFSNVRRINGITTLLHTANIARGHSGGPLLDQCGRVLGVNALITRNENGDAPFAFAVGNRELAAFLSAARQPYQAISSECVAMADRVRQDEARLAAEARAREATSEQAARAAAAERERALIAIQESRETRAALAILLLALAMLAFGGGGILLIKNRQRPAMMLGGGGALLLVLAVIAFVSRPSRAALEETAPGNASAAAPDPARFAGANLCRLVPERSRVTVSFEPEVPLEWSESGCMNGRTQYAREGEVWTRILVPDAEPAVSVLRFNPARGEYVVDRYLLDAERLTRARALRRDVETRSCGADEEARTILADRQREIAAILPRLPNERLVYTCENQGASGTPG
ncbi:MAG: S1C family serine protease [Sphingosinicella sp.]|uniref:S1C family serine protease n=1 Tax=Sphingosinicella sp. TaxID=1917971 RepID=UPI004037B0CD